MKFNLEDITHQVINIYNNVFDKKTLDFDVQFVDNLYNSKIIFSKTKADRERVLNGESFINSLTGAIVLPEFTNEKYYILVNYEKTISLNFVGTIAHELTHLYDFKSFADFYNINKYDDIRNVKEYMGFYYWTEYNAKWKGYMILRNYLSNQDDYLKTEIQQIYEIKSIESKHHIDKLNICYKDYRLSNNATEFIYMLLHYFARVSVWCFLFPTEFNFEYFVRNLIFKTTIKECKELFELMSKLNSFNIANKHFLKINRIVLEIVRKM